MSDTSLETAVQAFKHKQRKANLIVLLSIVLVLGLTISILAYFRYQSRRAEIYAEQQREELNKRQEEIKKLEAALRWEMRTERTLNRSEILQNVTGEPQKRAIVAAIDLYEQKPSIPFSWGGKSPKMGFDSSGYVAYTLAQAGVLSHPEVYWSGRLQQKLAPVGLDKIQPGDVVFYPGGTCMLYLGGPDDLSIGALPGGITTGKLELVVKPIGAGRY